MNSLCSRSSDAALQALLHQVGSTHTATVKSTLHTVNAEATFILNHNFPPLQRLCSVLETQADLLDYHPHVYAEDGDSDTASTLDSITISDHSSLQEAVKDLGPRFNKLASICRPLNKQI